MRFWQKSLRTRLTLYMLLLFVVPVIAVAILAYQQGRSALLDSTFNRLETTATLKENDIQRWVSSQKNLVRLLARDPIFDTYGPILLTLDEEDPAFQTAHDALYRYLNGALVESPDVLEFAILSNVGGKVLLSTTPEHEGNFHVTDTFFTESRLGTTYVQNVYFSPSLNKTTITIATPVAQKGVLVAHLNLDRLDWIVLERSGLGSTGEAYLVDSLNVFVSKARTAQGEFLRGVHTEGIDRALSGEDGRGLYTNYRGTPVIGVYRWLEGQDMALLVEISEAEAIAPVVRFGYILAGISLAVMLVAGGVTYLLSRQISEPVQAIARTATLVAEGDLSQRVSVRARDEIGVLADSFNQMTAQLQTLYTNLEQMVVARTRRLEIVASLGERLSAILNVEELLAEVVNQIQESLGYYHAHIYLLDDKHENLVVAEGSGPAGQEMKQRGHSIPLEAPTSLVARAARNNEIVRVDNVREAPDWLPNPLLPNTYSEMAVPIVIEGEVVGVLDVQEDEIGGLDEGDASLLRSLANQVAVAIRNARLFTKVENALAEANRRRDRYVVQSWRKARLVSTKGAYLHRRPAAPPPDEIRQQLFRRAANEAFRHPSPAVVSLSENGTEARALVAPIVLGDRPIGALQLHHRNPQEDWDEDQLAIVAAVAEQVAQTAENLRLFEETHRQASKEQLLRQITTRLRQAPTLEHLARIAAEALGDALGISHTVVRIAPPEEEE